MNSVAAGEGLTGLSREQKQRVLGLFGWNVRDPAPGSRSQPLLFCTMCGVKTGLWNFKPDETDPIPGWQPGTPLTGVAAASAERALASCALHYFISSDKIL